MALHFATLGSGSSGNACLVETDDFALLLDCGLGPRQLAKRLAAVGSAWSRIRAVVLTHTHTDHWNERTLATLRRQGVHFYCHAGHEVNLVRWGAEFASMRDAGLVRHFQERLHIELTPSLRVHPLAVRHDGGPTFAFRIDGPVDLLGHGSAVGYAADLGCWDEDLIEALSGVDLLALEFNHDVTLERLSGRAPHLIARVLGDEGHLSNAQAAACLQQIWQRSEDRLRHVVQLHLSRQCNRPELAQTAARRIVGDAATVHVAAQDEPGPRLQLGSAARPKNGRPAASGKARRQPANSVTVQAWLPGMECD